MRLPRLPINVAPARQEILASYLARLAALHGLHPRELWESVNVARPGGRRRDALADRLAAVTGRTVDQLAWALPELRDPAPDWTAWRHQPQPGCPRCDARHLGGTVTRLLPHHRYVCTRHRYWIGPPDSGQPATPLDDYHYDRIVGAQRRHSRLLRRRGSAAAFDAVLTGFLICGHLWTDQPRTPVDIWYQWTRRAETLIPPGSETATFSASRLFAAVYPDAVRLAALIASPTWRSWAAGDADQQRRFTTEVGLLLGRPDYQPPDAGDAVAHWMTFDSSRQPSRPHTTFPDTRDYQSGRRSTVSPKSRDQQHRSAFWFAINRRGGSVILHHRHIKPVLIRDWSPRMDGIQATIFASQTTIDLQQSATMLSTQHSAVVNATV